MLLPCRTFKYIYTSLPNHGKEDPKTQVLKLKSRVALVLGNNSARPGNTGGLHGQMQAADEW